ncbi:MAG TPA: CHAT domain-containing protein [Thermoanaerobaculia bacterium]|nr:CHAT domain-containing protein [Thermoanaerobaculia bacterium]
MVESTTALAVSCQNPDVTLRDWCALGASVALAVGASRQAARLDRKPSPDQPRRFVHELAQVGARPFEGRLSGQPWLPSTTIERLPSEQRVRLGQLGGAAFRAERLRSTPETLHSLGLAQLFVGKTGAARRTLEGARRHRPSDPSLATDHAVALLDEVRQGETKLVARSLGAAIEAARLAPGSPEAQFNLALALEKVPLVHRARQAWQRYLQLDVGSPWAQEARQHLASLDAGARDEPIEDLLTAPSDQCDPLRGRTQELYEQAARWLGELAGGESVPGLSRGSSQLDRARAAARCLRSLTGDSQLPDELEALAGAAEALSAGPPPLIRGHSRLAAGVRAFDRSDLGRADADLASAELHLTEAGSPYRHWATFWRAAVAFYRNDNRRAIRELDALEKSLGGQRWPILRGRLRWVRALAKLRLGESLGALLDQELAGRDFQSAGLDGYRAAIEVMVAENLHLLGRSREAWKHRQAANQLLLATLRPALAHNLLWESALALLEEGESAAAEEFVLEAIDQLEELPAAQRSSLRLPNDLALLARIRTRLGASAGAEEALSRARLLLAEIPDSELRLRTEGLIDRAEAELRLRQDPAVAVAALTATIERWRSREVELDVPALFLLRAKAHAALGDPILEGRDLEQAADLAVQLRERLGGTDLRLSFSATVREIFDRLIEHDVIAEKDPLRAFERLERSRSFWTPAVTSPRPGELESLLPSATAVLQFHVTETRLLAWCLTREGTRFAAHELGVGERADLEAGLQRHGASVEDLFERLARLRALLLGPFAAELAGRRDLVFIADALVTQLPLAALWDDARRRFLIEEHSLAFEPSLRHLVSRLRVEPTTPTEPLAEPRALVVGVATSPLGDALGLEALRKVSEEVAEVADAYPASTVLEGEAATPDRLRAALSGVQVLHFAGHAVAGGADPDGAFLVLSPDEAASGALEARELGHWPLAGLKVVFLAACDTSEARRGHTEGLAPLVRPFLAAGVPSVIGTLGSVKDEVMALLAPELHRGLAAGLSPPEALRRAQLYVLNQSDLRLRQSFDWAAVQVYGSTTRH